MKSSEIYLAGGCFWGMQKYLKLIYGVIETEVGFANGNTDNPTYREVYTDTTGYAETVRVVYNPEKLQLENLIEFYFKAIDPLSINQQGEDKGTRYRTGVYYTEESDRPVIETVFNEISMGIGEDLLVELLPLKNWFPAEEYHQNYLDKNPDGYCHLGPELFKYAKSLDRE